MAKVGGGRERKDAGGWAGQAPGGGGGLSSGQLGSNPRMLESLVESGFHFRKACELLVGGKWTVGAA